jgi:hypothetical protein
MCTGAGAVSTVKLFDRLSKRLLDTPSANLESGNAERAWPQLYNRSAVMVRRNIQL